MKTRFQRMSLGLLLVCGHAAAGVILSDSTFNNGDWSIAEMLNAPASGTFSGFQVGSGGNPGSYRALWVTSDAFLNFDVSNLYVTGYNPSVQGAITTIDFSFDVSFPDAAAAKPPFPLHYDFVIFQDGTWYFPATLASARSETWETFSRSGLTAAFLNNNGGSAHPDFSAAGGPIQFGFFTDYFPVVPCGPAPCASGAVDNWSVTIHQASDAPEPGTFLLLLPAVMMFSYRKRQHSSEKPTTAM